MILSGDIHLTDKTQDEYRWRVLPWLARKAKAKGGRTVVIAGDLTDSKDRHSSVLVNRVVDELRKRKRTRWILLKGNHDYAEDSSNPFFRFLDEPNCKFYVEPEFVNVDGQNVLLLPHTKQHEEDWGNLDISAADCIVTHQTYAGAATEAGFKLEGIPNNWFTLNGKRKGVPVISGDVHGPQWCGEVLYVGAPHPVNFGDAHKTRALWWDGKKVTSIPYPSISKHKLIVDGFKELTKVKFKLGDQADVTIRLLREDFPMWDRVQADACRLISEQGCTVKACRLIERKSAAVAKGLDLFAKPTTREPEDVVREFCKVRAIDKLVADTGVGLVKGLKG